jgi:hypothetical protein
MKGNWRDRLLAAIDEDGRSDRAISLAAGLGPNFIGQLRGTKSAAPKKPNIEYVRKISSALGRELSSIVGQTDEDDEQQLRSALLAYGVHEDDLDQALRAIKGFVSDGDDDEQQSQDRSPARTAPANRRHAKAPSE